MSTTDGNIDEPPMTTQQKKDRHTDNVVRMVMEAMRPKTESFNTVRNEADFRRAMNIERRKE